MALRGWKRCPGKQTGPWCVTGVFADAAYQMGMGRISIIIIGSPEEALREAFRPNYEHKLCSSFVYRAALGGWVGAAE